MKGALVLLLSMLLISIGVFAVLIVQPAETD
jgi:hypothetical protein